MRKTLVIALAGAFSIATPTLASAQIVGNGGFEQPDVSGEPCCNTVPPGTLPNWTVTGDINVVNGTYSSSAGNLAKEGTQYLDLVGQSSQGSISQTIATVAGEVYTLSFWYSNNVFGGAPLASANWAIGALSGTVFHAGATSADLLWQNFTVNFVGTGSDLLSFTSSIDAQNGGVFLDAVAITEAVPEPAAWAMMIVGFGLAGAALRRRKQKLAIA